MTMYVNGDLLTARSSEAHCATLEFQDHSAPAKSERSPVKSTADTLQVMLASRDAVACSNIDVIVTVIM